MELHADVAPLAGLLGTWRGSGHGHYPTIAAFDYEETATFASTGKPWIAYSHRTTIDGEPRHAESGYVRTVGDHRLELVVALPTGHVEFGIGRWAAIDDGLEIMIESLVEQTPSAKDVSATRRRWRLVGDELSTDSAMAAVDQPLQDHLAARLTRVTEA
ncbi:heme-binding beta-barrel domain-containing protein [Mariniluteicoccus flavus]